MSLKQSVTLVLMALVLSACASTSNEERARAARVRVLNNPDAVRGCEVLGSVTDDDIQDLQKKAARLGGDVALVTMQSERAGGVGGAFRYSTYTTAEVYRCEGVGR